ncbi:MAG: hypothetical protein WA071_09140 [Undibacterium umbellatum]|uniref:hypothetical protein n=1 Tax=Undibacterium umbellatum TaxID=2762300 RepID=UPI003BB7835D
MKTALRWLSWGRQAFSWQDWLLFSSVFLATTALSAQSLATWLAIASWSVALSFFLLLKLLDELLDFDADQRAGRDSCLLRGEVSQYELWLLVLLILAGQLYYLLSLRRSQALIAWSLLTVSAVLLAHPRLAGRPVLYSFLHYLLLPGFAAWQFSLNTAWVDFQAQHALLMLMLYAGALQYELSRKLDLRSGYAGVLSLLQACLGIGFMNLLVCISCAILIMIAGSKLLAAEIIMCVFFATIYALVCLLIKPVPSTKILLRNVSGFSLLCLNLVIFTSLA